MQAAQEPRLSRWRGFTYETFAGPGFLVLFFAMGYLGVNGDEAKANAVYERARPVAKYDPKQPVYVTGKLVVPNIESPFIKPGRYLQLAQSSEVYAWNEATVPKSGSLVVGLEWVSKPRDPRTFSLASERNHPFLKKTIDLETVWPATARLVQDGKEYGVPLAELELPLDMPATHPKPEAMVSSDYKFSETMGEQLVLYQTEPCMKAPEPGCQRVRLSVLAAPDGDMTVVGGLQGDRLVPFEGTLKGSHGDYKELLSAYSFSSGVDSVMLTLQRWACSAGIWAGLAALQRPLRRLVRFSPWLSRARTPVLSGVVTVVVSPVTYLLHAYGLLLALAFVAALAWASREPAPSVA